MDGSEGQAKQQGLALVLHQPHAWKEGESAVKHDAQEHGDGPQGVEVVSTLIGWQGWLGIALH